MPINLPDNLTPQLADLARRLSASKLVLFGSRARGDNHERSDVDLAVYGMPEKNRGTFWIEAEELPTLLKFDIVHISPDMNPDFLRNIEKDGVTLYASEIENYKNAVARLSEALAEYAENPDSTVIRDGVIQRFEFTFELSWKSLREYMEDQGASMDAVFSKQVFKAAYAAGVINDGQVWLDMLASRNVTSHVYDDAQAAQVVADIRDRYIEPLAKLAKFYEGW